MYRTTPKPKKKHPILWGILIMLCSMIRPVGVVAAKPPDASTMEYRKEDCLSNEMAVSCAWMGAQLEKQGKRDQARSYYQKACLALIKPIGSACYLWGLLAKNTPEQIRAFELACKLQDPDGCTDLGEQYSKQGKTKEALSCYKKACVGKEGRGCHRLARYAFQQKKDAEALQWLRQACAYGYPPGCGLLGRYYEVQAKQDTRAEKAYLVGCRWKGAAECARLGFLYRRQNKGALAQQYFQKACTLRFAPACREIRPSPSKHGK